MDAAGMSFDAWYAFPPLDDSMQMGNMGQMAPQQMQNQQPQPQSQSQDGGGMGGNGHVGRSGTWW